MAAPLAAPLASSLFAQVVISSHELPHPAAGCESACIGGRQCKECGISALTGRSDKPHYCNGTDLQADSISMLLTMLTKLTVVSQPSYLLACSCRTPEKVVFFKSRILTCLTYTSRQGIQHRGQTAEQEDTKARKAKLQRPRTAAQGSRSHKQQA